MAISTEVIRKITIQGSTQGVDQATAALKGLADAQGNVAVVADTSSKRALSAEAAYNRQTLSVVAGARAQADLERALKVAQAAFDQGRIGVDEHAKRVTLLNEKYGQLSNQQKAVGTVMQDLNGRLAAATGSLGTLGQVLTSFGTAGIAVAGVVGTIALALNGMAEAAHALAQKAEELRRFSEVTGLTTAQVQALRSEASKFGVTGDEATTAIERFTAGFNQLRLGQGELLTQIKRVNPALADQMQMTTNAGDALTLFGHALAQVDDVFQRNALVKAATGKGGLVTAQFLTNLNVDRLTQSFIDAGRGLDEGLIKKLPQTEIEINKLKTSMGEAFTKQFAQPLLDVELTILRTIKDISTALANVKLSDDFKAFLNFATMLPRAGLNLAIDPAAPFRTARVQGSADRNDPLRGTPFQVPLRTGGMADLNDPLRGLPSQAKTPEAIAAGLKDVVGLLGSAATLTEQYKAKVAELNTTENQAKLTESERARALAGLSLDHAIAQTQLLAGALGASAPIELAAIQRRQQIDQANQKGAGISAQLRDALVDLARATALGVTAMKAQEDASRIEAATLGLSVGQATEKKLVLERLAEAERNHQVLTLADVDAIKKQAAATGEAAQALEKARIATDIKRDRQTALLSAEDVQIANQLKGAYPDIATALGSSEAAAMRFNNVLKDSKDIATQFTQGLVRGLMDGKSISDSLSSALKNLSARLADKAIEQLLSGDFEKAAISAISAAATYLGSLFTGNSAAKHADVIKSIDYVSQLQTRQIAATADMATIAGQLAVFDKQANIERMNNDRDGGRERAQLELTLSEERSKIIADFNAQAVENDKQAAAARLAAQEEINKRIASAQDRLFAATNDPNTLQGQLAVFDRQAQQDRQDEIAKGGQALVDLEAAQAAERFNIIKSYNDKITADAQATAKSVLDAQTKAATQIVDYLNNLNVGPDSALSPQARLAAAQTTFNSTSALAAGGNIDAYNRFTTDAENLRKAAQDFYASGAGYQAILATIKSTATNLPVVSGSTDPLVNAMLGVKTAVQTTTTAVTADTTATAQKLDVSIARLDATVETLKLIGQQDANVATGWYSRIVDQLFAVATYTKSMADYFSQFGHPTQVAPSGGSDSSWWNPFSWFQQGGVVGAYAPGGIVGNGAFNQDSVVARYAPGGLIALAGGEGIINAERTRQLGGASAINMLNRGMLPGLTSSALSAANDNRDYTSQFNGLMRVSAAGSSAIVEVLERRLASLETQIITLNATVRRQNNERPRPGAPLAQKSA